MTKVTIKPKQSTKEPVVHKIGNWYKYKGDYFILSDIEDVAVLVGLSGCYISGPVYDREDDLGNILTQDEFDSCCGGFNAGFCLVQNITISEE